jgi:hypothetical protein
MNCVLIPETTHKDAINLIIECVLILMMFLIAVIIITKDAKQYTLIIHQGVLNMTKDCALTFTL